MVDFQTFPLWGNLLAVALSAVVVWHMGARLERAVESIVSRTRISAALGGLILLPMVGSLPELATTIIGARLGNAALITTTCLAASRCRSRSLLWRTASLREVR